MRILTKSPSQTRKAGEILAAKLLRKAKGEKRIWFSLNKGILKRELPKEALVVGLKGELGSGKTTFLQGFAKGLRIKEKVLSPTFVLMRKFKIRTPKSETNSKFQASKFKTFYHIDCYRIQKPKEILDLNFKSIIGDASNIIAIEWAERISKILPRQTIWVKFKFNNKKEREIFIKNR